MSRISFLISFILLSFTSFSQTYIDKTKAEVRLKLKNYVQDNGSLRSDIKETSNSIQLSLNDPRFQPAEYNYGFDNKGKCISEKITTSCDSCIRKFLQTALDRKEYGWKKVNENQYVSEFSKQMLLELPADSSIHYFTILHTEWTRPMYDMLTGAHH